MSFKVKNRTYTVTGVTPRWHLAGECVVYLDWKEGTQSGTATLIVKGADNSRLREVRGMARKTPANTATKEAAAKVAEATHKDIIHAGGK